MEYFLEQDKWLIPRNSNELTKLSKSFKITNKIIKEIENRQNVIDNKLRESSLIKDYDGNLYKTVKIGNQVWMAENLHVSHFRNGEPILEAKTDKEWEKAGIEGKPAWCYYDNDPNNGKKYGKLYNWYAIDDTRSLAPEGWHVSNDNELKILEGTVDNKYPIGNPFWNNTGYRGFDAGLNLKSIIGWIEDGNGSGLYDYKTLPSGNRNIDGSFHYLGIYGNFWSSTEFKKNSAWHRLLLHNNDGIFRFNSIKGYGFSIRCLRD